MAFEPNDQIGVAVPMFAFDMDPQKAIGLAAQVFDPCMGELANGLHQMAVSQMGMDIFAQAGLWFHVGGWCGRSAVRRRWRGWRPQYLHQQVDGLRAKK
jgi:hypothetical protein